MNAMRPATPLTPALTQWLRRSFAYTPEPTSESNKLHAIHHDVRSRCLIDPRWSCDAIVVLKTSYLGSGQARNETGQTRGVWRFQRTCFRDFRRRRSRAERAQVMPLIPK
ncbi:hypothetical protein SCLCIDRAFT_1216187 [Scleroderma citrinum Foug A]|uniref:Uncharacterized protein n=1 Tax=Scleroderma citrinum Foug A TaxID=1036808 RepID=A0A0C3DKQ6_9AGAM|nr:hypothetical protein SCLCIDRAFT_1216187 [Scleroderma citrinum Foug A]